MHQDAQMWLRKLTAETFGLFDERSHANANALGEYIVSVLLVPKTLVSRGPSAGDGLRPLQDRGTMSFNSWPGMDSTIAVDA